MPPCDGMMRKCHLIPVHVLKRELPEYQHERLLWDFAVWVWGCGGISGQSGHHGHLDSSRKLRIPYLELPAETIAFAERHNLTWYLDRTYRRRARPHGLHSVAR
jgi:hypothetical protein